MGIDLSGAETRPPAEAADGPGDRRPAVPGRRWRVDPGAVLAWASVGPALAVAGWLVAAYPLARIGLATPLLAVPPALAAVLLLCAAARRLPPVAETPWWSVLATLGVSAGFAAYTAAHASGHVVLRRDSAVYALLARWIAHSGGLTVPADLAAVGGADPSVGVLAPGLYPAGDSLTSQFMSGTALTLAPAGWGGGWGWILTAPALVGGLALLAVAGIAARLLGPRWAPAAALALGLTQPVLLTSRSTYSEPLAQLLLFAALCLLVDAVATAGHGLAAVAGLVTGLGLLVRIDAVRELALLIPVVAVLALVRHPTWVPLAGGAAAGAAYGALDAFGPSRPYLSDLWPLLRPGVAAGAGLLGLAAVGIPLGRWLLSRPAFREGVRQARPVAAAGAVLLVAGVAGWLAARPYLEAEQGSGDVVKLVESLQRAQVLPVDPDRSYAEQSVRWASWFVGWPVLVLAAVAAAVLSWRAVRGSGDPRWALALWVPAASALAVLWRPGITPDHPWADRRLVPTVLPVVLLLALWAVATTAAAVRRRGGRRARWWAAVVAAAGLAALLYPAEAGSRPLRDSRTEAGEPAAVDTACAVFRPGDVALMIDARGRQEWSAPLREVCAVPAFGVPAIETDRTATRAEVETALARVRAAGRRPVLVAQSGEPLPRLTGAAQRRVVDLDTWEHGRSLTGSPRGPEPLSIELWVAEPG